MKRVGARSVPRCVVVTSRSSSRREARPRSRLGCRDRRRLLGDVDADGTPGDAPPAPDAAGRVELVPPRRELVRHPLAVTRRRRLREPRRRADTSARGRSTTTTTVVVPRPPARSVVSRTSLQKHVGQTIVQFAHDRQRSATSAQRGWSRLRASTSARPSVSRTREIRSRRLLEHLNPRLDVRVTRRPIRDARQGGAGGTRVPARPRKRCPSASSISVSARSNPRSIPGPVPIEEQKHVAAGNPHSTTTMKAPSRRSP